MAWPGKSSAGSSELGLTDPDNWEEGISTFSVFILREKADSPLPEHPWPWEPFPSGSAYTGEIHGHRVVSHPSPCFPGVLPEVTVAQVQLIAVNNNKIIISNSNNKSMNPFPPK